MATQPSIVLFLAANPEIPELRLGRECREIEERIRAARFRNQLRLYPQLAARPRDLLQALLQHEPAVLHFSGHGAGAEGLCLLNDNDQVAHVTSDALGMVLQAAGEDLKLVVLNSCYSKVQADVLVAHIPCVIGMPDVIGDSAAITYAAAFYGALACGKSVAGAHNYGRAALALHSMNGGGRDIVEAEIALRTLMPELVIRDGVDAKGIYIVKQSGASTGIAGDRGGRRSHVELGLDIAFES